MSDWKSQIEEILRQVPGYNPWDQAAEKLIEKLDPGRDGKDRFRLANGSVVGIEDVLVGAVWLDHAAAAHAINWFAEHLKHVEGSARGEAFVLRRWQAAIVGNLFGWKRKDEAGRVVRRYRKCFIKVGRGNGKSPLASGIVLYAFFEDKEAGAQCYLAAGQKEQAGILFRNAKGMVEQDNDLLGRVTIYAGSAHRSMVLKDDQLSFCKTIPAEAAGQHGGIPHITVVDELHVQENRELLDVFETAMSKKVRSQPLMVMITTSDYDRESICNEVDDYAHRVRDNGGDPAKPGYDPFFLPVLYELSPEDDWRNEDNWVKANPNLDVSVSRESLAKIVRDVDDRPALENEVKRLHFNLRTGQKVALVPMDRWDAGAKDCPFTVDDLKGRPCYGGMDLSSTEDLSALDLLFPMEDEWWAVLSWAFCPADKLAQRVRRRFPYDVWQRQGCVIVTDGNQIDYRAIRRKHDELRELYDVRQVGYDPHGATQFAQDLMAEFGEEYVVTIPQTFGGLTAATKEVIRRVKMGRVAHFGNPVLRWAASNVAPHVDGRIPDGAKLDDYLDKVPVIPSKRKSAEKIDPFAALVDAAAVLTRHPEVTARSVYESRGVIVL